jgi:L-ascorbate metabolism protein UlaG (beta-lactamase superfamily)
MSRSPAIRRSKVLGQLRGAQAKPHKKGRWKTHPPERDAQHLGGVRFPVTGPARYTMTARDAVELCRSLRPRIAIPVHYEGWAHFWEDRATAERVLAAAPQEVRWLPIGEPVEL